MQRKLFIRHLSANTIQLAVNQCTGLLVFWVLSRALDKGSFGQLNWSLAVLLPAFAILSCGIDQLVVRKVATGDSPSGLLSLFFFHAGITGGVCWIILLAACFLFPSSLLLWLLAMLGSGKLFQLLSTPFKQVAAGLERFRLLMWMSVGSGLLRSLLLICFLTGGEMTLRRVAIIFAAGDLLELLITLLVSYRFLKVRVSLKISWLRYRTLFREALPQLGTVILAAVMARLDWILIGLFLPAARLAEYSFAYKVYELSAFPLLVIAPLLIPRFAKIFRGAAPAPETLRQLQWLLELEMMVASLTALVMVIVWSPVMDGVSGGKYGAVNRSTILVLSACLPLLYLNNFLWTIQFSRNRLGGIFRVFACTFAVNAAGDLILIPVFHNEGAAFACLLALLAQAALFLRAAKLPGSFASLLYFPALGLASGWAAVIFFPALPAVLLVAVFIFMAGVVLRLKVLLPGSGSIKKIGMEQLREATNEPDCRI